MKATVLFYDNDSNCFLEVPNHLGGKTWYLFHAVSECWNYAKKIGATITRTETRHENGEVEVEEW